jgi:hypothetical protein
MLIIRRSSLGLSLAIVAAWTGGCGDSGAGADADQDAATTTQGDGDGDGDPGDGDGDGGDGDGDPGDGDGDAGDGDGDQTKFDMAPLGDTPDGGDLCTVGDDQNGVGECGQQAPPDSFDPVVQWQWTGQTEESTVVTPLVANLTDDNDDGVIDLCDIPDVVVVAWGGGWSWQPAHIYVLDGATGVEHFRIDTPVHISGVPAIGDIDNDARPEIVTLSAGGFEGGTLIAFEDDGSLKWSSNVSVGAVNAVALADIDTDGDVEILAANKVVDHTGQLVFAVADDTPYAAVVATTAADLDDDDLMEVIVGRSAYRSDGSVYYMNDAIAPGVPQVADLDADGQPEILLINADGISMFEHDGTVVFSNQKPTGDNDWRRPATVHDLDGDGMSEFAVSASNHYTVYEGNLDIVWTADVADLSGLASGTAFDFLGDGSAEAMYGDENQLFVFDDTGTPVLTQPRESRTQIEYPVVADIDNDGSAEIVLVSETPHPTVQVLADAQDRWIQARRIWNQHTYHVTNVREDGSVPQYEPKNWLDLNTFRTNAQIEGGQICEPVG